MKFTAFRTIPAVVASFQDEGDLYFAISEDQDPLILARVQEAEVDWPKLPEGIEMVWTETDECAIAFREVDSTDETQVSGDLTGFGKLIGATYAREDGVVVEKWISEGDDETCEEICAGFQALLEPVRIVADIYGGGVKGLWADRPVKTLFVSNDSDYLFHFEDACLVPPSENMADPHAWWLREAGVSSDIVDHYHSQVTNEQA